jgi:TetR/AcrR family transcriptional regulator
MKRTAGHTRDAILAAGAAEFAAHGFAGASVDDIAARAGFNKAMIYYHFTGKRALYIEILRDVFRLMGARSADILAADLDPHAKIAAFIDAFDDIAASRPYMPPIMMREMAEGARRLDADTLRLMAAIIGNFARILDEGARLGVLRPADPLLTYFSVIAPVIFFRASEPIREALGKARILAARVEPSAFVANLKQTALVTLASADPAATSARARRAPRRRPRTPRSGDHA